MSKMSKVHFMTSYFEYLLRAGIRSEDDYIGDASRFLRFLLANTCSEDVFAFFESCRASPGYRRRMRRTLRRFFEYSRDHLEIESKAIEAFGNTKE